LGDADDSKKHEIKKGATEVYVTDVEEVPVTTEDQVCLLPFHFLIQSFTGLCTADQGSAQPLGGSHTDERTVLTQPQRVPPFHRRLKHNDWFDYMK
jgi:hypothetical protein